jgi:hypothetical protein
VRPESSCNILASNGNNLSRVTDDYVKGLMANRHNNKSGEEDDNASIGSNDTAKLSYTKNDIDSGLTSFS